MQRRPGTASTHWFLGQHCPGNVILVAVVALCVNARGAETDTAQTDTSSFPDKRPARPAWEYVVSTPGWLIGAPIILTTKAVAAGYRIVEEQKWLDKLIQRFFLIPDPTIRVIPAYSDATGGGLSLRKTGLVGPEAVLEVSATYGTLHRHGAEIAVTSFFPFGPQVFVDLGVNYDYIPDESFFGIGNDTDEEDETDFGLAQINSSVTVGKALYRYVRLGVAVTLDQFFIFRGEDEDIPTLQTVFADTRLPGLDGDGLFLGPQLRLYLDFRDTDWRPRRGVWFYTYGGFKREVTGKDLGFWLTGTDVRVYLEAPWLTERVLVLRSALLTSHSFEGTDIPFYSLNAFDGTNTVRGYSGGRYRDNEMLIVSAEYRFLIWEKVRAKFDGVVFVDAGQVRDRMFEDASVDGFHLGAGGGFRVHNDGAFLGSAMVGFGEDEVNFDFEFGF